MTAMPVPSPDTSGPVWPWLIIVGGLLFVGVIGVLAFRRKMKETEFEEADFSLQDLKEMLATGKLTQVEYKAAREVILKRMEKTLSDNGDPKGK